MGGEGSSRGPGKPGLQPRTLPSSHPRATGSGNGNSATSNDSSSATTSGSIASAVSAISATTTPDPDASGPSPTSNSATATAVAPASPQAAAASPPAAPAPQPAAPASQPATPAPQPAAPAHTHGAPAVPPQPAATAAGAKKRAPPKPAKKLPSRFASWGRFMLPAHWLVSKPNDSASSNDQLRTQPSRSTMHSESRPCTPAPASPPHPSSESPGRAGQLTRRVSDWCHSRSKKGNLKRLRDDTDSDSPEESDDQSRRRGSEDQHTQAKVHKNALLRNPAAIHKYFKNQDREVVQ